MRWWQSSSSDEIKPIPFLAPQVIQYLENLIQPDWRILEHGSGGSTLWFAERCKEVIAVENNAKWRNKILEKGIAGISVVPFLPINVFNFNLLLIDGEPLEDRANYLLHAYDLVKPGGVVVLDNANRPQYAKEREWLQNNCEKFITFDCNEHTAEINTTFLVTEFCFLKGENASRD